MRFLILTHDADRFGQEIYLHGLNLEFKNLKSADIIESAQATTELCTKIGKTSKWPRLLVKAAYPISSLRLALKGKRSRARWLRK